MRTKEEIEQILRGYHRQIENLERQIVTQREGVARMEAELAALPTPPVRLRAAKNGCIFAGTAGGGDYFARVFAQDCERAGIDQKEFTEYLLRFGQPDTNAEALARLPLLEAVADAARAINFFGTQPDTVRMNNALAALDSAKGWTAPNAAALAAADALAEAVAKWPHAPLSLSAFRAAYRKAREVQQ